MNGYASETCNVPSTGYVADIVGGTSEVFVAAPVLRNQPSVVSIMVNMLFYPHRDLAGTRSCSTREVAQSSELSALRDRIFALTFLEANWAGDDTEPVGNDTATETWDIVAALPKHLPLPQVSASGQGEVVLTWFRGRDRLEAIVAPDLYLTWVSRLDGRNHKGRALNLRTTSAASLLGDGLADFYK